MELDLEKYAMTVKPVKSSTKPHRREPFLKGPVPMPWLRRAADAGGSALEVGIALWHRRGMAKYDVVKAGNDDLLLSKKCDATARRGLKSLEKAGLVEVIDNPGQKHQVRILRASRSSEDE